MLRMSAACAALIFSASIAVPATAETRAVEEIVNAGEKESRLSFSTGLDFSSGDYGERDRTEIIVAPFSLRMRADDWLSFSVSVPWVRIDGPDVVLGPDNRPLPGFPIARRARSGIGDLGLSATISVPTGETSNWLVDFTARTKLPTSKKSQGLTSGKTDFSVSFDISYIAGNWLPFVDIGMRFPGSPAGVQLRNSPSVSVGATRLVKKGAVIVSYDYDRAFSLFSVDSHSIFTAYTRPVSSRLNLTGYGIIGLSNGAPSKEAGFLLTIKLD